MSIELRLFGFVFYVGLKRINPMGSYTGDVIWRIGGRNRLFDDARYTLLIHKWRAS